MNVTDERKGVGGGEAGKGLKTYARREIQPKGDRTCDTAFSRPVGADDHIEVGTGPELDVVVGDKVVKLDADDGACDVAINNMRKVDGGKRISMENEESARRKQGGSKGKVERDACMVDWETCA